MFGWFWTTTVLSTVLNIWFNQAIDVKIVISSYDRNFSQCSWFVPKDTKQEKMQNSQNKYTVIFMSGSPEKLWKHLFLQAGGVQTPYTSKILMCHYSLTCSSRIKITIISRGVEFECHRNLQLRDPWGSTPVNDLMKL